MTLRLFIILGAVWPSLAIYIPPGPRFSCPKDSKYIYPCSCVRGTDQGLFIRCENANLANISPAFVNLGNEAAPIEELVLYKCDIARWYGPALYPLDVRVLRIIDTPLKSIEEHSFLGVNRTLQELHVVHSKLETFPTKAFQILGNLSVLVIQGHRISQLAGDTFSGSMAANNLVKLEISNGTLSNLPVESLAPLSRLKFLHLHRNEIAQLKRNQFRGLRDTEFVDLAFNSISKYESSYLSDLTRLTVCNLSHNAIDSLPRAGFSRNLLLRVLDLGYNKLRKIDTNTFRGMRYLRKLHLNDNLIKDVGRGTFSSISKIGSVDLARNAIKKIDFQMFSGLPFADLLDISENAITVVQKMAFKDLYLTTVNLSHNAISTIEAGAFENCVNMTVLDLSYNKLANISKYAFDSITYPSEVQLSYNFLTSLDQFPMHNMTGLRVLNVTHNKLRSVPRLTFPKLYELHTIDLSHNNISEIFNGIFQTLFGLRSLNLSHNSLTKIKPGTFGTLPTVFELDLSHNMLEDIARGSLSKLSSCREITVSNNKLKNVFQLPISLGHLDYSRNELEMIPTTEAWPSMNSLLSLDLSHNRLGDNLQYGSFAPLLIVRILNLQANNITRPPWAALSTLSSLQYLYLQDNQLTRLDKAAFGSLPIVFELNMANNFIEDIQPRAFEGLLQLLTLNFTNNRIQHIPNGAFQGLVSLRTLDLSHNELEKLDNKTHGLLDDCLSLEKINLSHNKISFITRKTLPSDPYIPYKLQEVDLSYNTIPVLTFEITIGAKKVTHINLSHNNINDIRRYVIGNLTSLQTLDLSYNDLNDLIDDVFNPPATLTNLYLNDNHLSRLPMKKILSMPNLQVLNLENNQFATFDEGLLISTINNGTTVYYSGNPVHCDCHLRPLRRWFSTLTELPAEWTNLTCSSPEFLAGKRLSKVSEEVMTCGQREVLDNPALDITPDIKFRNIDFDDEENSWKVTWFVTARGDIGDFYVVVREIGGSKSVIEKDVVYKERSFKIRDLPESTSKYEVCVLARDSIGNVKHFRNSQCQLLNKHSNVYSASSIKTANLILISIWPLLSHYYAVM